MAQRGFTLLEITVVVAIMTIVTGAIFLISASLQSAYRVQEGKVLTQDAARNGLLLAARELRQASLNSITSAGWPATSVSYRAAMDADGNGWPVDGNGEIELSPVRTMGLDTTDANGDGKTTDQLVLTEAGNNSVRVLASDLVPDTGVRFESVGGALRVTLSAMTETGSNGAPRHLVSTLTETVMPRN
jgi:prepilin-type N-terminal cleavage/methylation domain-containing protein